MQNPRYFFFFNLLVLEFHKEVVFFIHDYTGYQKLIQLKIRSFGIFDFLVFPIYIFLQFM